ncbi:MAG TPA: DUF2155 domain-containing protein [Geobacter sp.]|nr:DUF2155 domain-containing protein [Geobacter sp.]HCE67233.1 DUF2155 domain-containing protein [Geobacter sp.]
MTPALSINNLPFAFLAILLLAACQGQEQQPVALKPRISHKTASEKSVIVPPEVASSWKAVKIAVIDKTHATENIYTIPVGGVSRIPSSKLTISAEAFLPSFVIEGTVMTSSSNELKNPGVKVSISENGTPVFKGWLFSKYPATHAISHPKYGFTLVGVVPVPK